MMGWELSSGEMGGGIVWEVVHGITILPTKKGVKDGFLPLSKPLSGRMKTLLLLRSEHSSVHKKRGLRRVANPMKL